MLIRKKFYQRNPRIVAKELLGKILVRKIGPKKLSGIIVETEAYFGTKDPASRAYHGLKLYNKLMWGEPGRVFIYNVHKYWMFNLVAHEPNKIGAVLIRAIQPLEGIEMMKANRKTDSLKNLTNGPGRLTQALKIDKSLNDVDATSSQSPVFLVYANYKPKIGKSHRIGVKKDLREKLRFFIKDNPFVSK